MTDIVQLMLLVVSVTMGIVGSILLIRVGHRFDLLDHPGRHKRHRHPTPYLGGTCLFVTIWGSLGLVSLIEPASIPFDDPRLQVILIGALTIFLIGLADDLRPLPAWLKLVFQAAVGLLLWSGGLGVDLLVWPTGEIGTGWLSLPITMLWVILLTNAVNLIDGLDGLAGGVSLIAAVSLYAVARLYPSGWELLILIALIGFLAPFLYFNRHPAKLFLGDSGSLQIGYYFAAFSLLTNFKSFAGSALYLPLLALGVPILEATSSFLRRALKGRNVMQADRRHLFHFLAMLGLSPGQVVTVFYGLGVVFGLSALAMRLWDRAIVLAALLVFMVVILTVFFILVSGLPERMKARRSGNGNKDVGR